MSSSGSGRCAIGGGEQSTSATTCVGEHDDGDEEGGDKTDGCGVFAGEPEAASDARVGAGLGSRGAGTTRRVMRCSSRARSSPDAEPGEMRAGRWNGSGAACGGVQVNGHCGTEVEAASGDCAEKSSSFGTPGTKARLGAV